MGVRGFVPRGRYRGLRRSRPRPTSSMAAGGVRPREDPRPAKSAETDEQRLPAGRPGHGAFRARAPAAVRRECAAGAGYRRYPRSRPHYPSSRRSARQSRPPHRMCLRGQATSPPVHIILRERNDITPPESEHQPRLPSRFAHYLGSHWSRDKYPVTARKPGLMVTQGVTGALDGDQRPAVVYELLHAAPVLGPALPGPGPRRPGRSAAMAARASSMSRSSSATWASASAISAAVGYPCSR